MEAGRAHMIVTSEFGNGLAVCLVQVREAAWLAQYRVPKQPIFSNTASQHFSSEKNREKPLTVNILDIIF